MAAVPKTEEEIEEEETEAVEVLVDEAKIAEDQANLYFKVKVDKIHISSSLTPSLTNRLSTLKSKCTTMKSITMIMAWSMGILIVSSMPTMSQNLSTKLSLNLKAQINLPDK